MATPSLSEWLALSEDERARRLAAFDAYAGEGEDLLEQIADRFREEFGRLPDLAIDGPGIYHGGSWVIGVTHPFIFDRRLLPARYLGVEVRAGPRLPLPPEFEGQTYPAYVWSPPNFERFVDRCAAEIRVRLGDPNMTREGMLHALIGRPFDEHLSNCRRWVKEGVIPAFE